MGKGTKEDQTDSRLEESFLVLFLSRFLYFTYDARSLIVDCYTLLPTYFFVFSVCFSLIEVGLFLILAGTMVKAFDVCLFFFFFFRAVRAMDVLCFTIKLECVGVAMASGFSAFGC